MSSYKDQRKKPRKKMTSFMLVKDAERKNLLGYLHDLSLVGARINGKSALEIGTRLALSIELPASLSDIQVRELNIAATVKNCTKTTNNPASYEIGFSFDELSTGQRSLITKLLERYRF